MAFFKIGAVNLVQRRGQRGQLRLDRRRLPGLRLLKLDHLLRQGFNLFAIDLGFVCCSRTGGLRR